MPDLTWRTRQKRTFAPSAAMHKYTAWPTVRRAGVIMTAMRQWREGLLITTPACSFGAAA